MLPVSLCKLASFLIKWKSLISFHKSDFIFTADIRFVHLSLFYFSGSTFLHNEDFSAWAIPTSTSALKSIVCVGKWSRKYLTFFLSEVNSNARILSMNLLRTLKKISKHHLRLFHPNCLVSWQGRGLAFRNMFDLLYLKQRRRLWCYPFF